MENQTEQKKDLEIRLLGNALIRTPDVAPEEWITISQLMYGIPNSLSLPSLNRILKQGLLTEYIMYKHKLYIPYKAQDIFKERLATYMYRNTNKA